MSEGVRTIIYPVRDLAKAKRLFRTWLGTEPQVDQPYYVGFSTGDQHIGLNPNGHASGMTGPVAFAHVADIQANLKALIAEGATAHEEVKDVGGGRLVASVKDADGNIIGVLQDL